MKLNKMKTIKLLLILLLIVSCSKESIEDEQPVFVDNCGLITSKRYVVMTDCYEIKFQSDINGNIVTRCIEEDEWLIIDIGDDYCYGQTSI
jgi:hypothetical protein